MSGLQVICGFHLTGSIFLRAYSLPGIGGGYNRWGQERQISFPQTTQSGKQTLNKNNERYRR